MKFYKLNLGSFYFYFKILVIIGHSSVDYTGMTKLVFNLVCQDLIILCIMNLLHDY